MKKKNKRTYITLGIISITTLALILFSAINWGLKDLMFNRVLTKNITNFQSGKVYSQEEVAVYMHQLANSLIIAADGEVRGKKTMNKKNLDIVLAMAKSMKHSEEKEQWINIIEGWKNGDFSHIVNDHNRVWSYLKGEIGEAVEPDLSKVQQAAKRLN